MEQARLSSLGVQEHQASNVVQGAGQAAEAIASAPFKIAENLVTKIADGARQEGAGGVIKGAFEGATDAPLLAFQAAASGSCRLLHGMKENARDIVELVSPELCEPLAPTDRLGILLSSDCEVSVGQGSINPADEQVYYPISVTSTTDSWTVTRRYSEFDDLQRRIHEVLVKQGKRKLGEQLKQLLPVKSDAGEVVAQTVDKVLTAFSDVFRAAPDGRIQGKANAGSLEQRSSGLNIYLQAVFQNLGNEDGFGAHSRLSWFLVPEHSLKHAGPDTADVTRRCSWCLRRTVHQIKTVSLVARNIYTCTGCRRDTLLCLQCCTAGKLPTMSRCCDSGGGTAEGPEAGMARHTPRWSHDNCNLCRNKIIAWPLSTVTCKCGCGRTVRPGRTPVRWTVEGDGVETSVALRSAGSEAVACIPVARGTACTVVGTTDDQVFTRVRCSQRDRDRETTVEGWVRSTYLSCRGGRPYDTCCRECAKSRKSDPEKILAPEQHASECIERQRAERDRVIPRIDNHAIAAMQMIERMLSRLSVSGPPVVAQAGQDIRSWAENEKLEHNLMRAASVIGVWPPRACGPGLPATCATLILIAAALKPLRAVPSTAGLTLGAEQVR
eukprot:COSAG02_NODE_2995_length_7582_cov_12.315916_2_plen_610_part_00